MHSPKSIIIFSTVSVLIAFVASAPIQSNNNNNPASETEATNLQMALPRIGASLPGGVIPPVIPAPVIPSAPKLPGNLGINGNRWGASLLPKLEGVLGGLIGGIGLDSPVAETAVGQEEQQQNAAAKHI